MLTPVQSLAFWFFHQRFGGGMSWASRVLGYLRASPIELSATDLQLKYQVPKPWRALDSLRRAGCVVAERSSSREMLYRPVVGADAPPDARIENARRQQSKALAARLKKKQEAAAQRHFESEPQ
jgi:hypothetical protein